MKRRQALTGGVAVAAAAGGLGWALWHQTAGPGDQAAGQAVQAGEEGKADATRPLDVWGLRFDTPDGAQVALASLRGQPLLLNFWATWCPPCVEEMPLLDRFQREHRAAGWRVLGLAVDSPAPVREFLVQHPVGFPIGLAGMEGVALSRSLGNASGALPFSVIFDSRGEAVEKKLGTLKASDLSLWFDRVR